jgi:hypothetical protein
MQTELERDTGTATVIFWACVVCPPLIVLVMVGAVLLSGWYLLRDAGRSIWAGLTHGLAYVRARVRAAPRA